METTTDNTSTAALERTTAQVNVGLECILLVLALDSAIAKTQ